MKKRLLKDPIDKGPKQKASANRGNAMKEDKMAHSFKTKQKGAAKRGLTVPK